MSLTRASSKNLSRLALAFALAIALAACAGDTGGVGDTTTTATGSSTTTETESGQAGETTQSGLVDTSDLADASELEWDESEAIGIELTGSSISTDSSSAVAIDGTVATITAGGTYVLSGELEDGQVIIDSEDDNPVKVVLDGVSITSSEGPAFAVASAERVVVILVEGSVNYFGDSDDYPAEYVDANLDSALVSKADLAIGGAGLLAVTGNYNDAISSSDGLYIHSGEIVVEAADDGIRGKDYLVVGDGSITVSAGGDGLKSDNDEDATRGYIVILDGTFTIESGGDAVAAETDLSVASGDFELRTTGEGDVDSAKGLKAGRDLVVDAGDFTIDSVDDAVHSNGTIVINGGELMITTGDDGMHADAALTVNSGAVNIIESYEGLESAVVTIEGGDIEIVSSDDGINISGGNDGSGEQQGGRGFGGGDQFASEDQWLYVNGGTIVIEAGGDGVDVNGYWEMTDGTLIVHGPIENMNGALDVNGTFEIDGGVLVAVGSGGMAESPDASSQQAYLFVGFNGSQSDVIEIQDEDGNTLLVFESTKPYQSLVFSSPDLVAGGSYEFFTGTTPSGDEVGGVYGSSTEPGTSIGIGTAG